MKIAPIIMHERSEENEKSSPNIFQPKVVASIDKPTTTKIEAIAKIIRFALDLKNLQPNVTINPKAAPKPKEMRISNSGTTMIPTNDKSLLEASDLEIENKTEKAIKATASSKATTGIRVSTTGPLALYCLITISVAAGAVAHAIAPRVKIIETGKVSLRKI